MQPHSWEWPSYALQAAFACSPSGHNYPLDCCGSTFIVVASHLSSVIFVNENENENSEKWENNEFVN